MYLSINNILHDAIFRATLTPSEGCLEATKNDNHDYCRHNYLDYLHCNYHTVRQNIFLFVVIVAIVRKALSASKKCCTRTRPPPFEPHQSRHEAPAVLRSIDVLWTFNPGAFR